MSILCDVTLGNQTGAALVVKSHYHTAFDGLSVNFRTPAGEVLGETSYLQPQSPYSIEPRDFPLPEGDTSRKLAFDCEGIPADLTEIIIQVVGTLPGSDYAEALRSNSITIKITEASQ